MKQWMKTSLLWGMWLGAAGLIILGASIVPTVQTLQTTGIKNQVIVNFNHWTSTQYNQFQNSTVQQNYYVFNITNLAEAMAGTQPINVQEIGPIRTNKISYKYNFDTTDNNVIKYNQFDQLQIADQTSAIFLSQTVVVVNPSYLGGMTLVGQALDPTSTSQHPAAIPSTRSELAFTAYYISQVATQLNSSFTDPSQTLLSGLKPAFIPFYFQYALTAIATVTNDTQTTIVTNWAGFNPAHTPYAAVQVNGTSVLASVYGFELPNALSSGTVVVSITAQTGYGLFSPTGLPVWLSALQGNTTAVGVLLANVAGLKIADINTIGTWIFSLTSTSTPDQSKYATYQGVIAGLVNKYMPYIGLTTGYTVSTWSDIGLLQFGTGMVTTLLIDPPTQWTAEGTANSLFLTKTPTSMYNLSPTASLGATWSNPYPSASTQDIEVLELSTSVFSVVKHGGNTVAYAPQYTSCLLTLQQSQAVLSVLSSPVATIVAGFLLTSLPQLSPVFVAAAASQNNTIIDGQLQTYYGGALQKFVVLYPQTSAANVGAYLALQSLTPFIGQPNFYACLTNWLVDYMATLLTGSQAQNTASLYNVAPQNSGLFSVLTMGEVIFGYTSKLNASIPGYSGYTWDDFVYYQQYLNPKYNGQQPAITTAQQLATSQAYNTGKLYIQNTGQINLNDVGSLQQYAGAPAFQYHCQRIDPNYSHECASTTAGTAYRAANDVAEWNELELIAGSSDGTQFQPFSEGTVQQNITIYTPEIRRVIPFVYVSDYTYNGIKLRRYNANNLTYQSGTTGSQYSNPNQNTYRNDYKYNTGSYPDGLINVASAYGGSPLVGSSPHMLYVDNTYVTGLQPSADLHNTNVDVEPLSGKTMHVNKRLQANIELQRAWFDLSATLVQPSLYGGLFAKQVSNTTFVPYAWVEVTAAINDDDASTFKSQIYTFRMAANIIQIVGLVVGSLEFVLFSVLLYRMYRARRLESNNKVMTIGHTGTYVE